MSAPCVGTDTARKDGGFLEQTIPEFEAVTEKLHYPHEYVPTSDLPADYPVTDVVRMCDEYEPTKEAVVMFTYLTGDGEIATAHP